MEEFANFLCDKCICWKTDMLVFMRQIIFVKYQHLFVCMTRHIYVANSNNTQAAYCLLRSGSILRSSKERSMRPARWSSYRWKAEVLLFNATDRPQIQQLFAVSSTLRKYVYLKREVAHQVGCSPRSVSDILKKTATFWLCERSQNSSSKRRTASKEDRIIVKKSNVKLIDSRLHQRLKLKCRWNMMCTIRSWAHPQLTSPALRGFFSGYYGFPSSLKSTEIRTIEGYKFISNHNTVTCYPHKITLLTTSDFPRRVKKSYP